MSFLNLFDLLLNILGNLVAVIIGFTAIIKKDEILHFLKSRHIIETNLKLKILIDESINLLEQKATKTSKSTLLDDKIPEILAILSSSKFYKSELLKDNCLKLSEISKGIQDSRSFVNAKSALKEKLVALKQILEEEFIKH